MARIFCICLAMRIKRLKNSNRRLPSLPSLPIRLPFLATRRLFALRTFRSFGIFNPLNIRRIRETVRRMRLAMRLLFRPDRLSLRRSERSLRLLLRRLRMRRAFLISLRICLRDHLRRLLRSALSLRNNFANRRRTFNEKRFNILISARLNPR